MKYTIYNDDYKNILPSIKNKSVDAIICDPPYNIDIAEWDNDFNIEEAIISVLPLLKPNGNLILFQGWSTVTKTIDFVQKNTSLIFKNWVIWDRIKGRGAKNNFASTREDILWFSLGEDCTFNKMYSNISKKTGGMGEKNGEDTRALTNVWYDISPIIPWGSEHNGHPTQKPYELMDRCINIWTDTGDLVLDFTMGSGTTGVAALKNDRSFIGCEINSEYFEIAKSRIEEVGSFNNFADNFLNSL